MTRYNSEYAHPPGTVTAIRGIIFQSDGHSTVGRVFIRPFEALDRWIAGVLPSPGEPSLAMHAGIHVTIDGEKDYVAEQLVGTWDLTFKNGLNWTPYDKFKERDRGGWDVTVAATDFRPIDQAAISETVATLNRIKGHPFVDEDCTAFVERAFNGRRMFADSPLLRSLGIGARVGDPALPMLHPDAKLDERTKSLLQFDEISNLPEPLADADAPNLRVWLVRLLPVAFGAWLLGHWLGAYSSSARKSTPISSTARKFLR